MMYAWVVSQEEGVQQVGRKKTTGMGRVISYLQFFEKSEFLSHKKLPSK